MYTTQALAESWNKMANMVTYNKFAMAASDLSGKWTSNFTGMTQYVNAYTGADAGSTLTPLTKTSNLARAMLINGTLG